MGSTVQAKSCKVTIDSGAEESVWPVEWESPGSLEEPERKMRFMAANGMEIGHYGKKVPTFSTKNSNTRKAMNFEVTDVKKPLASVRRIVEKGNEVRFGPGPQGNYIRNLATGEKIPLKLEKGGYVMEIDFVPEGNAPDFSRQAF